MPWIPLRRMAKPKSRTTAVRAAVSPAPTFSLCFHGLPGLAPAGEIRLVARPGSIQKDGPGLPDPCKGDMATAAREATLRLGTIRQVRALDGRCGFPIAAGQPDPPSTNPGSTKRSLATPPNRPARGIRRRGLSGDSSPLGCRTNATCESSFDSCTD